MKKQKEIKKYLPRALAVGMSLTIMCSTVGVTAYSAGAEQNKPAAAQSTGDASTGAKNTKGTSDSRRFSKEETVYVIAGADGNPQKVIVSDWIKNPEKADKIKDKSNLTDIENVKGDETYSIDENKMLEWGANGQDIYYKGKSNEQLPVGVSIQYTLDGKPVAPKDLAGKSGKLKMTFTYTNRRFEEVKIGDKKEKIYVPFVMLTGMMLDNEKFTNVNVSNGKVINDGNHTYVAGFALPGLNESLALGDKLDLPSSVEITADVKDFELATTLTVATNDVFNDIDTSKFDGDIEKLKKKLKEMTDGVNQLADGSSQLYSGLNTLLNKSGDLIEGVNQLYDGANQLQSGAASLDSGAGNLESGAATLDGGVSKLQSGVSALDKGAGDLSNGAEIYQGCDSAFWTLIWRNYQSELGTMMLSMMNGLKAIAQAKNLVSGSGLHLHDYVYAALSYYFFGQSAKYFPQLGYYHDRKFAYLDPWQVAGQTAPDGSIYPATYNNVYPLPQALGDRYQDERLWIYRRIAYIFSKYGIGAFSGVGDGWGQIAFTLSSQYTFNIKPAIDLYPVGSVGGDAVRAARTQAGQVAALTIAASQGTGNYINGADWLADLGDLHDLVLLNRTGGSDKPFTVAAQRMEKLKVGDDTLPVTFNATSLEVTGPAFKEIDAQNVVTIAQEVDLRFCPRLRRALFGGCSAPGLLLPVGSRVNEVSFPSNLLELFLHSLNQLEAANMTIDAGTLPKIQTYYFNKCAQLNPLAILASIIATGGRLEYVSMVWEGTIAATNAEWTAIVELAEDVNTVPKYRNVTYDPSAKLVNDDEHRASVTGAISVGTIGKKDYQKVVAAFPNLSITAERIVDYLTFEDARVWEICCYNWGDTRLIAPGNAFATGEIEADGSALAVCDHVFASCLVHPKRTMSDGTSPAQVAAAARTFEVELQFDTANPFSSIAAGSTVIEVRQYASNTNTQVVVGTLAKEDVVLDGDNKLTITTSGTTNACQYLTVAVLANNGVKATYTFKVASTSASGIYQPVGITQEQCAAVSSLGNIFQYSPISSFNEFKYFTSVESIATDNSLGCFRECVNLRKIEFPVSLKNTGYSTFQGCVNLVTCITNEGLKTFGSQVFYGCISLDSAVMPSTTTSIGGQLFYGCSSMRWVKILPSNISNAQQSSAGIFPQQVKIFVPDAAVSTYKSNWGGRASNIYRMSEFEVMFPEG